MDRATELIDLFDGLQEMCSGGYAIGLHLSFTTSKYIFQTYPRAWMEEYSREGLILQDPTIRWGIENTGAIGWSDLAQDDPGGVIAKAGKHGLAEGVSIAVATGDARSLGSFAKQSGTFEDETVAQLTERLCEMHRLAGEVDADTAEDKRIRRFAASVSGSEVHDI